MMFSINKKMNRFILLLSLVAWAQLSGAQVRATTESGNKVLLFDDGTWKYEEKKIASSASSTTVPVAGNAIAKVEVDETKDIKSEEEIVLYRQSARLVRYFGEEKGKIRCKLSCSNKLGAIRIHYHWDIPVGDAQRYYGFMKRGTKLTFHMADGKKVNIAVAGDSKVVGSEKYNKSSISGMTEVLTREQLTALIAQTVDKLEVDWKKKSEKYEFENPNYFMVTLPTVF